MTNKHGAVRAGYRRISRRLRQRSKSRTGSAHVTECVRDYGRIGSQDQRQTATRPLDPLKQVG